MGTVTTQPSLGSPPPVTPRPPRGHGGDGGNDGRNDSSSGRTARFAIYVGMVASTMTFLALVAAMFMRRGLSVHNDWRHMPIPPLLWWNTAALFVSSIAIDLGRRAFRAGSRPRFRRYWLTGTALGAYFLIGQAINWRFLVNHGFYMRDNPASAFFYILTMAHAAHVVGALAALIYVSCRTMLFPAIPLNRNVMEVSAIFWHFLDVMWLVLMAIFVFWI
jgi:cytochrome c oxidase subunit 3